MGVQSNWDFSCGWWCPQTSSQPCYGDLRLLDVRLDDVSVWYFLPGPTAAVPYSLHPSIPKHVDHFQVAVGGRTCFVNRQHPGPSTPPGTGNKLGAKRSRSRAKSIFPQAGLVETSRSNIPLLRVPKGNDRDDLDNDDPKGMHGEQVRPAPYAPV